MSNQDQTIGLEEAAQKLAIHRSTVIEMVKSGKLQGRHIAGHNYQISVASIEKVKAEALKPQPKTG